MTLEKEYKNYLKMIEKKALFEFENKKKVDIYDLRLLGIFPPIYVLILDSIDFNNEKLYKCGVLTEEISLASISKKTPILRLEKRKTIIACLPFHIYLMEDFLYNYSEKIANIKEKQIIDKIINYIEKTTIPENIQGNYIKIVMKNLSQLNTYSILRFFDDIEKFEDNFQIIKLSKDIQEWIEKEFSK